MCASKFPLPKNRRRGIKCRTFSQNPRRRGKSHHTTVQLKWTCAKQVFSAITIIMYTTLPLPLSLPAVGLPPYPLHILTSFDLFSFFLNLILYKDWWAGLQVIRSTPPLQQTYMTAQTCLGTSPNVRALSRMPRKQGFFSLMISSLI